MKNKILIILLLFQSLLNGCAYDPWYKIQFINVETDSFSKNNELPKNNEAIKYYVNGSFVNIFIIAKNETMCSSNNPFFLYINAKGIKNVHKYIVIKKIQIKTSSKPEYEEFHDDVIDEKIRFAAIEYADDDGKNESDFVVAAYSCKSDLILNTEENEIVNILLDIEVKKQNSVERKNIEYEFTQHSEKGYFRPLFSV